MGGGSFYSVSGGGGGAYGVACGVEDYCSGGVSGVAFYVVYAWDGAFWFAAAGDVAGVGCEGGVVGGDVTTVEGCGGGGGFQGC